MKSNPSKILKDGARCKVVNGSHKGKSGIVQDINTSKTGAVTITVKQKDGVKYTNANDENLNGTEMTKAMRDNVTQTNALAVDRLNAQGVNIFGKTNVPVRLADFQSYNPIYGTTNNPWDIRLVPGGSSGGSEMA